MKTLFTLVLLSLVSLNTYADDLIRFKRIDQEIDHARVNCLHRDVISSSKTTQQVRSYQTVLAPRFFERLLDKSHFLSFENLKSPSSVHARGADSLASVEDVEIEILVKTPEDDVLISTLFFWTDTPKEVIRRQEGFVERFDAKYQGPTNCSAQGPRLEVRRCLFSTPFDTADFLDDQVELIDHYAENYPGKGLIIEVHYRNTLYAECTSTNAQAVVRGIGSLPRLYLRQLP